MKSVVRLIALSAAVFGLSFSAFAQDNDAAKPDVNMVVTASRGEAQDPLDVPQAITSVSREKLDTHEYFNVEDAISREANVGGAPAEGNPNYWSQGFTIRGLGAQRVLTLSDGVRQAGQGIGYGGGNLSLYDPYSIERIEILKGPASVLYGTDAFGGVVNVITRNPKERTEFGTNGAVRYGYDGSRNLYRFNGYLDVGDKDYGLVGGGGFIDSGRPNLPDDNHADSGSFRNSSGWGKFNYKISNDTTFRINGDVNNSSDILVTDSAIPLPIATFGAPGSFQMVNSPLYFTLPEYRRSLLGSEIEVENISDTFKNFKSSFHWQRLDRKFHRESAFYPTFSPGFSGPPTFVDPSASVVRSTVDTNDTVDTYEFQNQARFKFGGHEVTAGFDMGYDQSDLPETEVQTLVARAGVGQVAPTVLSSVDRKRADAHQYRFGWYGQDKYDVSRFTFTPGLRLDYYTVKDSVSDFDDSNVGVSGSLGTLAHLNENHALYLNLASGYRAPDLGERFQNGIVNIGAPTRKIGKPGLDAERAYTAELGAKGRESKFSYDVAGFYNHVKNYIGSRAVGLSDGFVTEQFDNVGTVNLYGAEVGGKYNIVEQVALFANAGRTYTQQSEKVDVPNWVYNYGVEYTQELCECMSLKTFRAALVARSVADSIDNTVTGGREPFPKNQGFTTLNLEMSLDSAQFSWGRANLVGGIRNIFDKKYREPFFNNYQPGVNGYVGIEVAF